jgi:hypothetical protein
MSENRDLVRSIYADWGRAAIKAVRGAHFDKAPRSSEGAPRLRAEYLVEGLGDVVPAR